MKRISIYQKKIGNVNFYEIGSVKCIDRFIYLEIIKKLWLGKNLYCLIKKPRWQIKEMADEGAFDFYYVSNLMLIKIDSNEKLDELFSYLVACWNYYFLLSESKELISLLKTQRRLPFNAKEERFDQDIFSFIDTIVNLGHDDMVINIYTQSAALENLKSSLKEFIKDEIEFNNSEKQLFGNGFLF